MKKNSIINLKEVIDGRLQIEINSSNDSLLMDLQKKHCEPINELGEILFEIYDHYNEDQQPNDSKSLYLFWECDSSQYSLEFILHPKQLIDLKVSYCPDIFAGIHTESELKISVQMTLKDLMEDFLKEMKNVLLNYGFIGYRKRWQRHDFPIATFLKLYHLLHGEYKEATSLPPCLECLQKIVKKELIFTDA